MTKKPPVKGKRFFRIAKMTAKVAGNYASSKANSFFQNKKDAAASALATHILNGEIITDTLGELKGAAMKVGQMASLAGDFLPPEIIQKLKILQNESPPMDYEIVESQIEFELGDAIEILFDTFDPLPFKAASIGQVHRATLDGEELVVKIQYPGVDESCDSDLNHMRRVFKLTGWAYDKDVINRVFDELKTMLHEELDYTNEAENIRKFRRQHKEDDFVIIPRVIGERSSGKILTMTFEEGVSAEDVERTFDQDIRNKIGVNIFRLFGSQLFRDQLIHGDPHPGNFAFREDGTIVLYDFGCVKKIPKHYIKTYKKIVKAVLAREPEKLDALMFELKIRKANSEPIPAAVYESLMEVVLDEFLAEDIYDYKKSKLNKHTPKLLKKFTKHMLSFQPNGEIALVDRLVLGAHNLFRIIGPEFRWQELMEEQIKW